jgi:hypothetical protein
MDKMLGEDPRFAAEIPRRISVKDQHRVKGISQELPVSGMIVWAQALQFTSRL